MLLHIIFKCPNVILVNFILQVILGALNDIRFQIYFHLLIQEHTLLQKLADKIFINSLLKCLALIHLVGVSLMEA